MVNALRLQPELKLGADIAKTEPGKPQTIMLLGSDRRPKGNLEGAASDARSDTIILVRLDPKKKATALMSLPRDLKVKIPGHGTDKINAAYELGGPRLTLKTVKQLTGLRINHVINIDFRGFYAGRQRPRLHLRRRRPALLQQQRPVRLHQRARRLPAPVRPRGAPVRALPLRGQRPRALRAPAGLPAPGQAAGGRRPADRGPLEAGEDLRQVHLVGHPRPRRGAADRQARGRLDRPAGARGPLRGPDRRRAT